MDATRRAPAVAGAVSGAEAPGEPVVAAAVSGAEAPGGPARPTGRVTAAAVGPSRIEPSAEPIRPTGRRPVVARAPYRAELATERQRPTGRSPAVAHAPSGPELAAERPRTTGRAAAVARTPSSGEAATDAAGPIAARGRALAPPVDGRGASTASGSVAPAARRPADAVPADDGPPSAAARSHDRSTVRLRRLSRTVAPVAGAARAGVESPPPQTQRQLAGEGERVAARRTATPAEPAPEPAAGSTDPGRLAALTGGSLVDAPDGRRSVVFPSGGQEPRAAARSARTASMTAAAHPALPQAAPATASIDVDELYDQIVARLRRELLLDRERAGELP